MSIGYACLTVGVPQTDQKSCILKNANETRLLELINYNLNSLERIIDYNIKNNIKMFRISSDIITFGSSPANQLLWWDIFSAQLLKIGEKIKSGGIRVSMHPGQYTVLNSPHEEVVKRAIEDLKYHTRILDSLGVGPEHKIVLHIGGIYNDKKQAINRFISNYNNLDNAVKQRLVIENDDKSYNINDVLEISNNLQIPVIFDNLHHKINSVNKNETDFYWIDECKKTWKEIDGHQKMHYSQQNPLKKTGSHSTSIAINEFITFFDHLNRKDIDIMLEVKDKNLSAVKCINATTEIKKIEVLELEWSKYKYTILENSPNDYLEIRKLLRDKKEYPVIPFYNFIEEALKKEITIGNSINAAMHVWGYFKDVAIEKEKKKFFENLEAYKLGKTSIHTIKNYLWKMANIYQRTYLLDSYYFVL